MADSYITVAPELIEYADAAREYLRSEGYRVSVEPTGLYYPNTPTLLGKLRGTEYVVEVCASIERVRLSDWLSYARARRKDTFVVLAFPPDAQLPVDKLAKLREQGFGVLFCGSASVEVIVEPVDLANNVGLPDLSAESAKLRRALQGGFRKIANGANIDGFKDAVGAFETEARKHLCKGLASGRIKVVNGAGKQKSIDAERINRMTLGQLGVTYSEILAPTQADDLVRRAIESVLQDRNDATHHASDAVAMRRVKKNIPKHVFAILNAMRVII